MQIETQDHRSGRRHVPSSTDRFVLVCLVPLLASLLSLACSNDSEDPPPAPARAAASEPRYSIDETERNADPRPSVVLIVIDTLRADAVSSYGSVEGTTPTLDQLGESGLRFRRAFAPAPWTVSSHTTLFTGLRVDQHGVGLDGSAVAAEDLLMMAESFRDAGYVTAGFAENALVSPDFGFEQGFDHFESMDLVSILKAGAAGKPPPPLFDLVGSVRRWNAERDKSRPYFVFINIYDAHDPYLVREVNPWLPSDTPRDEAEYVKSRYDIPSAVCDAAPRGRDLEILRGLYLGNVAAADAKLASLLAIFEQNSSEVPDLTIVTADHGEHLGEHRLMGHQYSVRNPVLEIPMIVVGLPDVEPVVIEHPVELRQLHDSILCWALDEICPASLPTENPADGDDPGSNEPIISIYSDSIRRVPVSILDRANLPEGPTRESRASCTEEDRVQGDMVSMIRYPMKITWFENGAPILNDLSWDPSEVSDLMAVQAKQAEPLRAELETFVQQHVVERQPQTAPGLSEEGIRALKALGYVE